MPCHPLDRLCAFLRSERTILRGDAPRAVVVIFLHVQIFGDAAPAAPRDAFSAFAPDMSGKSRNEDVINMGERDFGFLGQKGERVGIIDALDQAQGENPVFVPCLAHSAMMAERSSSRGFRVIGSG